jgi:hypothetical protein
MELSVGVEAGLRAQYGTIPVTVRVGAGASKTGMYVSIREGARSRAVLSAMYGLESRTV